MEAENMKKTSFCEASQTKYRWSRSLEITLGNQKNVRYSPRKWAENIKNMIFGDATQTMYRWPQSLEIVL
jgi:hypothetical protein